MKLSPQGYPQPEGKKLTDWRPDRRGRLRPVYKALPGVGGSVKSSPALNTFLKDETVRTFGRKTARDMAMKQTAKAFLGGAVSRAVPIIGTALLIADFVEFGLEFLPGGAPIPRDPGNAYDMELTWPTVGWSNSYTGWTSPNPTFDYLTGLSQWVVRHRVAGSYGPTGDPDGQYETPHSGPDTIAEFWAANPTYYTPIGASALATASYALNDQVTRVERWNNPGHHTPALQTGDVSMESHTKTSSTAANPTYTNPQRVTSPMPLEAAPPEAPPPFGRVGQATNPWLSPDTQIERGPEPEKKGRYRPTGKRRSRPDPDPVPVPPTLVVPVPRGNPTPEPATGTRPNPRPRPRPRGRIKPNVRRIQNTRPRRRQKPLRGVKEKKLNMKVGKIVAGLRIVAGTATEGLDFVNAAYQALPKEFRPGYYKLHYKDKVTGEIKTYWKKRWNASQEQRIKAVWDHWEKIPNDQLVKNLIANQLEDYAFGKLGQVSQKAARKAGRDAGWQLGGWDTLVSEMGF